ncbi:unnamed protein product [Closterium sp. Yama58-4]|nr:unnamed protein product [Closterium sp. Yama58-4]
MSLEPLSLPSLLSLPVEAVSAKLRSTPPAHLEQLRVSLWDILGTPDRKPEFLSLQRLLITRTGAGAVLTAESLSRAHYTHLKILVAVRTGIQAFLHPDIAIPPSSLIEIFLRRRCQNMACQSPLPAGGCRCRFCTTGNGEPGGSGRAGADGGATKSAAVSGTTSTTGTLNRGNSGTGTSAGIASTTEIGGGFCNLCMCVACGKFDFDTNTCRWIGCDFCLHWCHTDCALHMGFVRHGAVGAGGSAGGAGGRGGGIAEGAAQGGQSADGATAGTSAQFACPACARSSELFGFVRDVFRLCSAQWDAEAARRELECVGGIFGASTDALGRELARRAALALRELREGRRACADICRDMQLFFASSEWGGCRLACLYSSRRYRRLHSGFMWRLEVRVRVCFLSCVPFVL